MSPGFQHQNDVRDDDLVPIFTHQLPLLLPSSGTAVISEEQRCPAWHRAPCSIERGSAFTSTTVDCLGILAKSLSKFCY